MKTKRLLALLLCICIVTAILPMASANDSEVTACTYTFHENGTVDWGWYDTHANAKEYTAERNWRYYSYATSAAAWAGKEEGELLGHSAGTDDNATKVIKLSKTYGLDNKLQNTDEWMAVEINIPRSGVYALSGIGRKSVDCGKVDIYLFKTPSTSVDAAIAAATPLGTEDFYRYSASDEEVLFADFDDAVVSEAGDYLFVVKGAGKNEASSDYLTYIPELVLTRTGDVPVAISRAELSVNAENISVGDEVETTLAVYDQDNELITEGFTVNYSSNSTAIEVSDEGFITAKADGSATITAAVTYLGKTVYTTLDVNVLAAPIAYNFIVDGWYNKLPSFNEYASGRNWRFYGYSVSAAAWKDKSEDEIFGSAAGGTGKIWDMAPNMGIIGTLTSADEWIAVEINIPESGIYSLSGMTSKLQSGSMIDLYMFESPRLAKGVSYADKEAAVNAKLASVASLGQENFCSTSGNQTPIFTIDTIADDSITISRAGNYVFVLKGTGVDPYPAADYAGGYWAGLASLSLTRTGDAPASEVPPANVEESDIFGDAYAYVKDGSVYFLGGLDKIDGYTKVGFEVWVDGEAKGDINTDKVYTSFKIDDTTYTAEDEFNSKYVFITVLENIASGAETIELRPYIANDDGKTYHDKDLILELRI